MYILKRNGRVACFFKAVCLVLLSAGLSYAVSLEQLVQLALEKDSHYKSQRYNASARKALGWQARVGYGPTVKASASYGKGKQSLQLSDQDLLADERVDGVVDDHSSVDYHQKELSVSLKQPLINLEKFHIGKWGSAEITAADVERHQAKEDLILRVCEKYFSLLTAEEHLRLAEEERNSLAQQVNDATERLLLGNGTITEQQNAQARYAIARAAVLEKRIQRDTKKSELEKAVGVELSEKIDGIPIDMYFPEIPGTLASWEEVALQHNSGYKLAQIQRDGSRSKLRAARSSLLPTVDFFANYNQKEPSKTLAGYGETREEMMAGIKLELELFSSGRDTFEIVAASRKFKAAEQNVKTQKHHILSTVRDLWSALHKTLQLIEQYEEAVKNSEQFMRSTKEGYLGGQYSFLDMLNSQQEYFRTVGKYRSSRYDYMKLCQQFKRALGVEDEFTLCQYR